ncbi:unnamed protein product [Periconia digitata]|uniref:Prion-inhibition and propagation HeLo domain-containing protein n=1 Tax=Periconia digitata TaxID=1303443 RepID=A0A9W4UW97_9PLEO|nr:unnamed protein product [Periconia digitata]
MALTNQTAAGGPPPPTRSEVLANVMTMAMAFSTCVEAFNLIHPHDRSDHHQKVALAKLGIQQGRLLIWGDVLGISSPPPTIARHMIPSHPGVTNPDPTVPINFGVRDPRLDEPDYNGRVRSALNEIAGRPSNMSRETLMLKYGLKSPKNFSATTHAALDTNRLEAFREKFALLKDLVRQVGVQGKWQRAGSMTLQKWTVRNSDRFDDFVALVRQEVDGLIAMMGVKEQVDRGMKTDIKSMAWHPDLSVPVVRADWDKLKLIREAVAGDYPEYEETADRALKYISDELREHQVAGVKLTYTPPRPPRRKSSTNATDPATTKKQPLINVESATSPALSPQTSSTSSSSQQQQHHPHSNGSTPPTPLPKSTPTSPSPTPTQKDKKQSFMSKLGLKSWGRPKQSSSSSSPSSSKRKKNPSSNLTVPGSQDQNQDPPRSFSEDVEKPTFEFQEDLAPVRSKSLSAVASPRRRNIDGVLLDTNGKTTGEHSNTTTTAATATGNGVVPVSAASKNEIAGEEREGEDEVDDGENLTTVETVKSAVDRHDMYREIGRLETRDIREKSKSAALGY